MSDENHLGKAGRSMSNGVQNAVDDASNGNLMDATKSLWNGTVQAAQEVGKSVTQATNMGGDNQQDGQK